MTIHPGIAKGVVTAVNPEDVAGAIPLGAAAAVNFTAPGWMLTGTWSTTGFTFQQNEYYPIFCVRPYRMTEIGVNVTSAGTGLLLAVYRADQDWQPTDLLLQTPSIDVTGTGLKSVAGLGLDMRPGRYMFGALPSANVTVRIGYGVPLGWDGNAGPTISGGTYSQYRINTADTTFRNPGLRWSTQSAINTGIPILGRFERPR